MNRRSYRDPIAVSKSPVFATAGFSLNDVRAHSRRASVLTLQGYIDVHNAAKTRRAIVDLVADALTRKEVETTEIHRRNAAYARDYLLHLGLGTVPSSVDTSCSIPENWTDG